MTIVPPEKAREALYKMQLHDIIVIDYDPLVTIRRVPGGWIYTESRENERCDTNALTATFVPYDNEFQVIVEPEPKEPEIDRSNL